MNFRIDPAVIQQHLPKPFRPKLQKGYAIAGICLIKLEHIRPKGIPTILGISSENAAHRIAVIWEDEDGVLREGVFIPRRDTDSLINTLAGGRLFPGEHNRASFCVSELQDNIDVEVSSDDGVVNIKMSGSVSDHMPPGSVFSNLQEASDFFESGSVGYSVTGNQNRLDGLTLRTQNWKVQPLSVNAVCSSYFSDPNKFPIGSVQFDCALLMKNLLHEWHGADDMYI